MPEISWSETFERQFHRKSQQHQRRVLRAVKLLMDNVHHPGLRRHRVLGISDAVMWSIRVSLSLRIVYIEHDDGSWTLTNCCQHDKVY